MKHEPSSHFQRKNAVRGIFRELILSLVGQPNAESAAGDAHCPDIEPPRSALRRLYDDIGAFLFSHRLDLTPLNFGCAHDYVAGGDPRMVDAVDRAIQERQLSNGWVEDFLAEQTSHVVTPNSLQDATAQLAVEFDRCLDLLGRSTDRHEQYGVALEKSVRAASPDELLTQLRGLTKQMIEQNKLAEGEMRLSHGRVSQLQMALRSARQASKHDHLTGLPNRRGFERLFETWRGSEGSTGGVLAICDIDHFKSVNDRFGHDTGDRVLRCVADGLQVLTAKGYEVARLGGEEFVILMPRLSLEQAADEVDEARLALNARNLVDSVSKVPIGAVTFSAGLTVLNKTEAFVPVLRRADAALYAAKRSGRNRIHGATDKEKAVAMRW